MITGHASSIEGFTALLSSPIGLDLKKIRRPGDPIWRSLGVHLGSALYTKVRGEHFLKVMQCTLKIGHNRDNTHFTNCTLVHHKPEIQESHVTSLQRSCLFGGVEDHASSATDLPWGLNTPNPLHHAIFSSKPLRTDWRLLSSQDAR